VSRLVPFVLAGAFFLFARDAEPGHSRSIGSPTQGHLIGGAHLEPSTCVRVCPAYAQSDVRWGLEELVGLLDRAAHAVRKRYPDAIMSVGHLSRAGGGEVDRHHSHESGRDADVGFYVRSVTGRPLLAERFVTFRADGSAPAWPGAFFDDARNWTFVEALVTDARARVAHVFVAAPLRARLLAFAERSGAAPAVRMRAAEVMVQPRGALPHDDHFHVRIACPPGMAGCIEYPTVARRTRPHHGGAKHAGRGRTTVAPPAGSRATPGAPATPAPAPGVPAPDAHAPGAPPRARPPTSPAAPVPAPAPGSRSVTL